MSTPFPIPLNALRAIEIVARRGALAPAAEELGVTVGAVSQHIRRAEARMGVDLFDRTPQGLVALPVLKAVLPQLSAGFATLADAVTGLGARDDHVLTLTVASVFATRWLIWRVNKFTTLHPDIELRLVVTGQVMDLKRTDIDCGIRYGTGDWEGARAEKIGGFTYRPVCAPKFSKVLKHPADVAKVPVIRDEGGTLDWQKWCEAAGIAPVLAAGPAYADPSLAFDAAISEQGLLLAVDMMSADAIGDGRLIRPFETVVEDESGYWLVTNAQRRMPLKVAAFRDWLAAEVPASVHGYAAQMRGVDSWP